MGGVRCEPDVWFFAIGPDISVGCVVRDDDGASPALIDKHRDTVVEFQQLLLRMRVWAT